ncbi:MAG: hypothetical protein QOG76_4847, partial [Pseudonocardiales bacterium]|nr:hypothetical protein [Pseudonocardiales bacterium]
MSAGSGPRVVCAGDEFISAELLAAGDTVSITAAAERVYLFDAT